MPNGPSKATNIAPRFNNNGGSQAQGKSKVDPGFNVNPGFQPPPMQGFPPNKGGGPKLWNNPGMEPAPGGGGGGQGGGGGNQGPGPRRLSPGWADPQSWKQRGFESQDAARSVSRQYGLVRDENGDWGKPTQGFLEHQVDPWMHNAYGNSTPVGIGGARWMVGNEGAQFTGQATDAVDPNHPNWGGGGAYNAGAQAQTAYNPGGGGGGGGRPNPRRNQGPGGMPNQGIPSGGNGGGGNRPGGAGGRQGGGRNGHRGGNQNQGGQRPGYPGVGTAGALGEYANFPAPQAPAENFLPMTPQFEAGRRGLADEQMSQQADILGQQALVDPLYQQQKARLETDRWYEKERMKEQLAGRGVFTPYGAGGQQAGSVMNDPLSTGGGIGQYLGQRDIQIPYGRQFSDMGQNAFNQYGGLNNLYGDTELAYNQGMAELLLGRAADAAEMMPMNVPQYSNGNRILRGQGYNNRPNKPNKNRGRRNRGRNK